MTLGLSRNNPANLLPEHVPWFGLQATQPEAGPLAFENLTDGIRAFVKLCYTYQRLGFDTPANFIPKFSPSAAGNPTAQYLMNVCGWTRFDQNEPLDFHDTPTMIAWANAIFRQEQGPANGITDEQIAAGISAAEATLEA